MSVTLTITYTLTLILLVILLKLEFCRNLMMFQQNSYRPERFRRWYHQSGESTSFPKLIAIFLFLLGCTSFGIRNFTVACIGIFALVMIVRLGRRKYKKPLVMTKRAMRLLITMFLVSLFLTAGVVGCFALFTVDAPATYLFVTVECLLVAFILAKDVIYIAAFLTKPIESRINRRFYDDAAARLRDMPHLKIVGITGSYGKTSTKHYLYQILSEQFETLMTPGSFNTTLGVVRTVREHLKPYHEVFIVEMGAKQSGDIKEICDLVQPATGIITAVGPQHLETFKTIENVRDTKFELVDSLPADGLAVVNNDYPIIADRQITNCQALRYSIDADNAAADIRAEDIEYHSGGTRFTVVTADGQRIRLETSLLGEYNIANLTGAVGVALHLGVPVEKVRRGVSLIEPVEHRLSMKRHSNGLTIIDDAFNSNPAGAAMAVKVLSRMTDGRRIIITPGMIELGERQVELNRNFGRQIAEANIDLAMIIGQYNRDAILDGLRDGAMPDDRVMTFPTFMDAYNHLISIVQPGDVALIENDLPDTFK